MFVAMPSGRRILCPAGMSIRDGFQYGRWADEAMAKIDPQEPSEITRAFLNQYASEVASIVTSSKSRLR